MNFVDLQRELHQNHGLMRVSMARLRTAYQKGRLSQGIVGEISEELRRRNIGHHPSELPTTQTAIVLLYDLEHPFAKVDSALESVGRDEHAVDVLRRVHVTENAGTARRNSPAPHVATRPKTSEPLADVIRCLNRAQFKKQFVGLKWFRDVELPTNNFSWASAGISYDELLRDAIARRIILTKGIVNPNNPQHPTTAIELNAGAAEVQDALKRARSTGSTFRPITPRRGEPLSETISRNRR